MCEEGGGGYDSPCFTLAASAATAAAIVFLRELLSCPSPPFFHLPATATAATATATAAAAAAAHLLLFTCLPAAAAAATTITCLPLLLLLLRPH